MKTAGTLVIAIEDTSTIQCVGKEGTHVAIEVGATKLVLLHVLDQHPLSGAAVAMSGYYLPIAESTEDGAVLLKRAEAAIQAEFDRLGLPRPEIELLVGQGNPSTVIEDVIRDRSAEDVVLGARHRHLFGRLMYSDVRAHLKCLDAHHIHVAPLQEPTATSRE